MSLRYADQKRALEAIARGPCAFFSSIAFPSDAPAIHTGVDGVSRYYAAPNFWRGLFSAQPADRGTPLSLGRGGALKIRGVPIEDLDMPDQATALTVALGVIGIPSSLAA